MGVQPDEGRDLVGCGVPLVRHRQATVRAGAVPVRPRRRGRGRAAQLRARSRGAPITRHRPGRSPRGQVRHVPRAGRGQPGPAHRDGRDRGPRVPLRPGPARQHPRRPPAAAPGRGRGVQPALAEQLFTAYFRDGEAIGQPDVLARLAAGPGSTRPRSTTCWPPTPTVAEVRADEEEARALGVSGVPFFVIDRRYGVAGAQAPDLILELLDKAWDESIVDPPPRTGSPSGIPRVRLRLPVRLVRRVLEVGQRSSGDAAGVGQGRLEAAGAGGVADDVDRAAEGRQHSVSSSARDRSGRLTALTTVTGPPIAEPSRGVEVVGGGTGDQAHAELLGVVHEAEAPRRAELGGEHVTRLEDGDRSAPAGAEAGERQPILLPPSTTTRGRRRRRRRRTRRPRASRPARRPDRAARPAGTAASRSRIGQSGTVEELGPRPRAGADHRPPVATTISSTSSPAASAGVTGRAEHAARPHVRSIWRICHRRKRSSGSSVGAGQVQRAAEARGRPRPAPRRGRARAARRATSSPGRAAADHQHPPGRRRRAAAPARRRRRWPGWRRSAPAR